MNTTEKSTGHIAFADGFEFFKREGGIYRAALSCPVMTDGYRSGRWECFEAMAGMIPALRRSA